jgi:abl interactor 2
MFNSLRNSSASNRAKQPPPAPVRTAAALEKKHSFQPPPVRRVPSSDGGLAASAAAAAAAAAPISPSRSPGPPPLPRRTLSAEPEPEPEPEPEEEEIQGEWAEALYDYDSEDPGDLPIRAHQRVLVVERTSDDWWVVFIVFVSSFFPSIYFIYARYSYVMLFSGGRASSRAREGYSLLHMSRCFK